VGRRQGPVYQLSADEIARFGADGWVHLPGVLAEEELRGLEAIYERFLRREIPAAGRDFCDMSSDYEKPFEQFSIVNVMLPRRYYPPLAENVYERRAASIAAQLCGPDMSLDYDQFVAKRPRKDDAVFHWHQDLAYWPVTSDTRTASFWLALDHVAADNGIVRFVTGSHREPALRPHEPLFGDRDRNHTLAAAVDERRDRVAAEDLAPGDVTIHHERTVHGSAGNQSDRWRRGYVLAFRSRATVAAERALGFTHSHNDDPRVLAAIAEAARAARR